MTKWVRKWLKGRHCVVFWKGNCETREDLLQNIHGLNTDSNSIVSLSKYDRNTTFIDEKKLAAITSTNRARDAVKKRKTQTADFEDFGNRIHQQFIAAAAMGPDRSTRSNPSSSMGLPGNKNAGVLFYPSIQHRCRHTMSGKNERGKIFF